MENKKKKKRINRMFSKDKNKYNFIALSALNFGIRLETLSEMLESDPQELFGILHRNCDYLIYPLRFLFEHGAIDQLVARTNFEDYLNKVYLAFITGDKTALDTLLKQIKDSEIIEFQKRHNNKSLYYKITDADIIILAKYQIKYGISSKNMGTKFNINVPNYLKRVEKLPDEYSMLKSNVFYLEDYYENQEQLSARRHNG